MAVKANANGHHRSEAGLLSDSGISSGVETDDEALNGNAHYDGVRNGNTSHESSSESEPIAIIGMACRLPGNVHSAEDLWDFLCEGKSAQSDNAPKSRFNADAFYNPNELPDTIMMRGGYFIDEDLRLFDNAFFGVHNLEATSMDPQMRKLLEVCYECLENAGIRDVDIAGRDVGCYVGNFTADYPGMAMKDPGHQHRLVTLAMSAAILSNRVSYLLNLMGPSLTLDTACSSSLYCLHLAVAALRKRECEAALVGGANLLQSHEQTMSIGRSGFLSKTSACHTFDSSADGYARADGVSALYLKRLSDAIRDGDPIRSVIRGTAINSNGKTSSSIVIPSTVGQSRVIAKAYADAGVDPAATDYVECHGTGTQIGDVIELNVLAESMRSKANAPSKPLFAGSVKTNLGHSEASSSITSIMKVTMALEQQWIPPTIGVSELNPKFDWENNPLSIVTSGRPWPTQDGVQRASINSFGFGGANGHCILERYVSNEKPISQDHSSDNDYPCILPLSAASKFSSRRRAEDLSRVAKPMSIPDLCHTLINRRSKLPCRGFLIAADKDWQQNIDLDRFESLAVQQTKDEMPLAFVFTGQGAQWPGMGKQLFHQFTTFRQTVLRLDKVLAKLPSPPNWTLADLLTGSENGDWSSSPLRSQTACTGLQIGLINLLKEWKVIPRYVVGHSAGEISAAYAAGHISESRAITIAYGRGMQVTALSTPGAMIAVGLSEDQANEEIKRLGLTDSARVACINSPESTTVSGDEAAIVRLLETFAAAQTFAKKLKTGGIAYHSHHMKAIGSAYQQYLEGLGESAPDSALDMQLAKVEMISTVHNRIVDRGETATAAYWKINLESPVRFQQAVETLLTLESCRLVEIGPHSALELPLKQTVQKAGLDFHYLPSIRRHEDTTTCLLNLAGRLWCQGYGVDLSRVNQHARKQGKPLRVLPGIPPYAWNYGPPLWKESRLSEEYRNRKFNHDELLGTLVPGMSGSTHIWRNKLLLNHVPWLADHKLGGQFVFPGAAYIDIVLKAVQQIHSFQKDCIVVRDMRLLSALTFDENDGIEIFTEFKKQRLSHLEAHQSSWEFTVSTWGDGEVVKRAVGFVDAVPINSLEPIEKMSWDTSSELVQKSRTWYRQLSEIGVNYGPTFQMLSTVSTPSMRDRPTCSARLVDLKTPLDKYQGHYQFQIHPTVLDAILQSGLIAHSRGNTEELRGLLPIGTPFIRFYRPISHDDLTKYEIRTREHSVAAGLSVFESELHDADGHMLMQVNVDAMHYGKSSLQAHLENRYPVVRVQWTPALDYTSVSQGKALGASLASHRGGRLDDLLRFLHCASLNRCDMDILALSSAEDMNAIWATVGGGSAHPRFSHLTFARPNDIGVLQGFSIDRTATPTWTDIKPADLPGGTVYDLILVDEDYVRYLSSLDLLASEGLLVCVGAAPSELSTNASITNVPIGGNRALQMIRHRPTDPSPSRAPPPIVIITSSLPMDDSFNSALAAHLSNSLNIGPPILLPLSSLSANSPLTKATLAIVTAELTSPLLTSLTASQLSMIQLLLSRVRRVLWITGSASTAPEMSAVRGLAGVLRLESPSVTFRVLELEQSLEDDAAAAAGKDTAKPQSRDVLECVRNVALPPREGRKPDQETHFLVRNGLVHVSRFVPDEQLNLSFTARKAGAPVERPLREPAVLEMDIGVPGRFDTLTFEERDTPPSMPYGDVEVEVKAIAINAKDVYALSGKFKTVLRTFAMEYAGVVRRVPQGSELAVGDRVAVGGSGAFASVIMAPEMCCVRLRDDESFTRMATVPLAYMTALHALEDRAALRSHESVLIHSAAGGVGMAAIQVARRIGATIYATTGTDEKRELLVNEFGLKPEHIFSSRDTSFLEDIKRVTAGRGVDVVLNSLTGERLHASIAACARFGRFVEIGKRDIADCGTLDLSVFSRSLTFTAFDLADYFYSPVEEDRWVVARLGRRAFDVFRSHPVPEPRVFDVSHVTEAYHAFANSRRTGKVCVSFEQSDAAMMVRPKRREYRFSPFKAYLLIGGLGGVGRSIARYMFENGARHFVFVGTSGDNKLEARLLVDGLRKRGSQVDVVVGDVTDFDTVRKIVTDLPLPLGGIVQGAMGLAESLFESMTHGSWHASLAPKVQGTWNLHRAIEGKYEEQLDFFLMISSLTGSMGSLSESNYSSANSFLDSFAQYRRQLGKPATSLAFGAISEVGYLHEHPEIEDILRRRGLTAITEADLLNLCDLALCRAATGVPADGHILTGLEGARGLIAQQQLLVPGMVDPRLSILGHAGKSDDGAGKAETGDRKIGPPPAVQAAINAKDHSAAVSAIVQVLTEQLSKLILTPVESIPANMTLSNAGIDSMLAAEYRSYIFQMFNTEIPFLAMMDAGMTMLRLATRIADNLLDVSSDQADSPKDEADG